MGKMIEITGNLLTRKSLEVKFKRFNRTLHNAEFRICWLANQSEVM
jgi:hypothetical protein